MLGCAPLRRLCEDGIAEGILLGLPSAGRRVWPSESVNEGGLVGDADPQLHPVVVNVVSFAKRAVTKGR